MRMFQALHKYYDECFTNGEFDENKVLSNNIIEPGYNAEERVRLLREVYKLVLEAKFINEMTREYLTHSNRTYEEAIQRFNDENNANKNRSTGISNIDSCQRRISQIFKTVKYAGDDLNFITWLTFTKLHMGIENSEEKQEIRNTFLKQFNAFNDIYGDSVGISKKDMLITMPICEKVNTLSDEEFDDFMDIINPYSKKVLETIQNVINGMTKEVGYFRFLISKTSNLSDVDIERKKVIQRWLGKDIIENRDTVEDNDNNDNSVDDDVEY